MGRTGLVCVIRSGGIGNSLVAVCVSANSADSFVLRRHRYHRCCRNVENLVVMDNERVCEMDIFVDSMLGDRAEVFAVSTYCSV